MISLHLRNLPLLERMSIAAFAFVFIIAGILHMIYPEFALPYMPPWIPGAWYWVFWTGPTEIIAAFAMLSKRFRLAGAWMVQAHLVGYLLLHGWHVWIGGQVPGNIEPIPLWLVWVRLAFQFVLIALMHRVIRAIKIAESKP